MEQISMQFCRKGCVHRCIFACGMLTVWLLSSASITMCAPIQFRLTMLELPQGATWGEATAINNHGQAVGQVHFSTGTVPVLWSGDNIVYLGSLGGSNGEARDINDAGQVVGISSSPQGNRAFLWSNGVMSNIGNVSERVYYTTATTITNSGQIYGSYYPTNSNEVAVQWTNPGRLAIPSVRVGSTVIPFTNVNGANEVGQVIGDGSISSTVRGVVYQQNVSSSLVAASPITGSVREAVSDINDLGIAVGSSTLPLGNTFHSVPTRYEGGVAQLLEMLPGSRDGGAGDINNAGIIIGANSFGVGSELTQKAVFWDKDGVHSFQDSLINPITGLVIESAADINEDGWIVGYGSNLDGNHLPILLIPVPELSSVLTMALFGAFVVAPPAIRRSTLSHFYGS